MKTTNFLGRFALFCTLLLFLLPSTGAGQETSDRVYVEVGCLKAKSPELGAFMMNEGMQFNKEAQAMGMLEDFIVLKVMYPNGEDCKCDYRVVTVFTDMKQLDMLTASDTGPKVATKAFGDKAMEVYERMQSLTTNKGSEIFELSMSAVPGPANAAISMVNFLEVEPGKQQEFEKMEKEVWLPVVREAIKAGMLKDFTIWSRVMPSGDAFMGDYIQVYDINNFAQMEAWEWEEFGKIFQKVHPEKDMMKLIEQSVALSTVVYSETLKVMGSLNQGQ